MQFGGNTQFGGGAKFGGGESLARKYYRILKTPGVSPPGVYDESDETLRNKLLLTDAKALGDRGKRHVEGIDHNIFPTTAYETLVEWEQMLDVVVPDGATIKSRQEAIAARWQIAKPSTLKGLRQMLYPVLKPSTAFWDRFDDENVSARFIQQPKNGSITENASGLRLECVATVNCDWNATFDNAPRVLLQIPDRNDDWKIYLTNLLWGSGINTSIGIAAIDFENSPRNAIMWGGKNKAGTDYYSLDALIDGVFSSEVFTSTNILSSYDKVILEKDGSVFKCYSQQSTGNEILEYQISANFIPRFWAIFAKNESPSLNGNVVVFDELKVEMATDYNNVEIIEVPLAIAQAGDPDDKFMAFVHREQSDPNDYDIFEAQRIADKASQAHTVLLVGESDCFLTDDEFSLTDRDILGS